MFRQKLEDLFELQGFINELFWKYSDRMILNRDIQYKKNILKQVYGWQNIDNLIKDEVDRHQVQDILEILLRYNNLKDLPEDVIKSGIWKL